MQFVSQVSPSLAQMMLSPMSVKADKGKAPETEEAHASLDTREDDSRHGQQTHLFSLLQRKPQLRHRKLANDIERLQDAERLKSQVLLECQKLEMILMAQLQASLFINIKSRTPKYHYICLHSCHRCLPPTLICDKLLGNEHK
jgi:hypothetical protein